MSKTRMIKTSLDLLDMVMQGEKIPSTGAYDTVKSTSSSMNDTYAHVLKCWSYWLSFLIVFTVKDILGRIIFVYGGSE